MQTLAPSTRSFNHQVPATPVADLNFYFLVLAHHSPRQCGISAVTQQMEAVGSMYSLFLSLPFSLSTFQINMKGKTLQNKKGEEEQENMS